MISDDPDEDAAASDDADALDSYLGADAQKLNPGEGGVAVMQDWPPERRQQPGLALDAGTLAWFKANHLDWRAEMASVLRGWVAAHRPPPQEKPSPTE